jgi:hypothetical protein
MSDTDDPTGPTPRTETAASLDPADPADQPGDGAGEAGPGVDDGEGGPRAEDPVRTVTRKGAAVGMAAALLAGGLVGWFASSELGDDDTRPVSAFRDGSLRERFGSGHRGFPGGGFPGGGFPEGGFPGHGGDDEWRGELPDRWPSPPGMDDDGDRYEPDRPDDEEDPEDEDDPDEGLQDEQEDRDEEGAGEG